MREIHFLYFLLPTPLHEIDNWIVPEPEQLKDIYKAVERCRVTEIEAEANKFKEIDAKYSAFSNKILSLIDEFDIDAIAALIEPYM